MPKIVTEYRQDRGALLSPKMVGDILFVQGYACRPGILEYRNDDGTITRELVTEETLRNAAIGLSRVAVTLEHPKQDVDNTNWSELSVGDTDKEVVIEDNGFQKVTMAVRRKDAQDEIMSKRRRELSPGYVARIDKTPGRHPEYGEYDAEQVERTYNHLAIVKDARGGSRVAIRVDGQPAQGAELVHTIRGDHAVEQPHRGEPMPLSRRVARRLALLGADVRRIDTAEEALEYLVDAMEEEVPAGPPAAPPVVAPAEDEGPDYPMNQDGSPMYQDAEGNPLTTDEYINALEQDNAMMAQQLEGDAEEQLMGDMEPMAEDMGVEVQKGDSAWDLAHRMASHLLGQELHAQTSPDFVWGVIQAHRADAGYDDSPSGRQAGAQAWQDARRDSGRQENVARRNDARRSGGIHPRHKQDYDNVVDLRPGLGEIARRQYDEQFKRRRDAARGER